jgi:hypothetical protein
MTLEYGVRFGPVVCRVETVDDCPAAARLVCRRLRHVPQTVYMDANGNVSLLPGYLPVPTSVVRWVIGSYNKDATADNIAADFASEVRERSQLYQVAPYD